MSRILQFAHQEEGGGRRRANFRFICLFVFCFSYILFVAPESRRVLPADFALVWRCGNAGTGGDRFEFGPKLATL